MHHETNYMEAPDGAKLFTQSWKPEGPPAAVLIISHGYAEHGGRYAHVGAYFAERGYLVCAIDHRGHGRSHGKDTYIESLDKVLADLDLFVRKVREEVPEIPAFLLGHSMGGEIVLAYVLKYQPKLSGILLSAPAVVLGDDISPFLIKMAGFLGKVAPHMKTVKLDGDSVSRDPAVRELYNTDPLNYRGGIPARTGAEMNRGIAYVQENLHQLTLPCFLANGSADKLVDPGVSQMIHDRCSSQDKTVKVYDGLYHEILNEPEKAQVMADMCDWMDSRRA